MPESIPSIDPLRLLRPKRPIWGISAILLPLTRTGDVNWLELEQHIERTASCGLTPAVNMDTGYVHLLDESTRQRVLSVARSILGAGSFVAGAFVSDHVGDLFQLDAYRRQIDSIQSFGATPVIFQSYGLTSLRGSELVGAYDAIGKICDRFIGFELGTMFAPFGKIYSLEEFHGLMLIRSCIGAKHSSLSRELEWERLMLRDQHRPDFHVFTGNDLAIDMVMYGSDYLLGLSTFAPDLFAKRDQYWKSGDIRFYALNDVLQYLGAFAFRAPTPAYKHSAAMFLKLRGWIAEDATYSNSPKRPESDREILKTIVDGLATIMGD